MDKSKLRRNLPAVHIKFGEPTAIMAGDLLFAKSFGVMHDLPVKPNVFKILNQNIVKCVEEICEGQQLDIEFEQRKIIAEREYIEMIRKKTSVLFMLSAEGAAIASGGTKEEINALKEYGTSLGLAFQIWDDYLDISSDEKTLGKDIGNDIRNGKKTLIAVHSLNNAAGGDKRTLEKLFGNQDATEQDVRQVFDIFKKTKSIEYAKQTAMNYCAKAKKSLNVLKESDAKAVLLELADYSIKREK
jgi:geranylgeranyl diphosphate synthase type I